MLDVTGLVAVATAFFVVAASPGPATIALATVSMSAGRRAGWRFGLGLSLGLAFWGVVAATGLGAILQASSQALTALKVVGGLYLLFLAAKAARASAQDSSDMKARADQGRGFTHGLLLNLSNPKAVLAWMATLSLGLGHGSGAGQVIAATLLCSALGLVIYGVYAQVLSTASAMGIYARIRRWVEGIVAGLFAAAGLGLLRSALDRS